MRNGLYIDDDGDKEWFKNGKKHREDGPAVIYNDGQQEWWFDGKLHREDGPAVINKKGEKGWFLNNEVVTEEEVMTKWNAVQEKKKLEIAVQNNKNVIKKIKL